MSIDSNIIFYTYKYFVRKICKFLSKYINICIFIVFKFLNYFEKKQQSYNICVNIE